jgi:prophage DNA circulation protein
MTPWREQLQPASFRGAAFFVTQADTEEGRRGVLHEYPQRDDPYVEDMGRQAGEFSFEAIIIGPDYFTARDALRDALKQPGAGELVHPTLGRLVVALTAPFRFTEDLTSNGGMARFSLHFTETFDNLQPTASINTRAVTEAEADDAEEAAVAEFDDEFDVSAAPEFVVTEAQLTLADALAAIDAARVAITPDLTGITRFVGDLSSIGTALAHLITTPATLALRVFGLAAALKAAVLRPLDAIAAMQRLFTWHSPAPRMAPRTPSQRRATQNRNAVEALVRRAALISAARASAELNFTPAGPSEVRTTYQQAADLREQLAGALEDEAAAAQAEAWGTLMSLRAAVVRDITARGVDLPRRVVVTMPATLPALVVAYRATGDAGKEQEIIAHNQIRHPNFVPGGQPLWVVV